MEISSELTKLSAYSPGIQKSVDALNTTIARFAEQLQAALSELTTQAVADQQQEAASSPQETVSSIVSSVLGSLQSNLAASSSTLQSALPSDEIQSTTATPQLMASTTAGAGAQSAAKAVTTLAPGEAGAGLPGNYLNSPLYKEWLARKPELGSDAIEYGRALTAWQESNPFYVNPKSYGSFDAYLDAVTTSTASGNIAAESDSYRYQSFLQSYYGQTAVSNLWASSAVKPTPDELAQWPESVRTLYQNTQDAQASLAALQRAKLL